MTVPAAKETEAPRASAARSITRLSINISEETARQLKRLAEEHDTSVTNIVRRAVSVYSFLDDELEMNSLQLVDKKTKETTTLALV